jgi:hypothetical protein
LRVRCGDGVSITIYTFENKSFAELGIRRWRSYNGLLGVAPGCFRHHGSNGHGVKGILVLDPIALEREEKSEPLEGKKTVAKGIASTTPTAEFEELLTAAEIAKVLKVSPSQVRILTLTKRIPSRRLPSMGKGIKNRFRYSRHDVLSSLEMRPGKR